MLKLIRGRLLSLLLASGVILGTANAYSSMHSHDDSHVHQTREALTSFPEYYKGAVHPGMYVLPWSSDGAQAKWKTKVTKFFIANRRMPSAQESQDMQIEMANQSSAEAIIGIDVDVQIAHPSHRLDFITAMRFVENTYLKKPLHQLTEKQWHTLLHQVNKKLWESLSIAYEGTAGRYRKAGDEVVMINKIYTTDPMKPAWGIDNRPAMKLYTSIAKKLDKTGGYHALLKVKREGLTRAEKVFIDKYLHFPPDAQDVEKLMNEFVAEITDKLNRPGMDPIEIAAFAHQRLAHIHPFEDANGRTARMVMNVILMQAGYPPVIFFKDKAYTDALVDDIKFPGSFACYLQKKVAEMETLLEMSDSKKPVPYGDFAELESSPDGIAVLRALLKNRANDPHDIPCAR